jgi:hypothetical protein
MGANQSEPITNKTYISNSRGGGHQRLRSIAANSSRLTRAGRRAKYSSRGSEPRPASRAAAKLGAARSSQKICPDYRICSDEFHQ